eukprot:TRINITY_DN5501_c0_g2_i1.p1 TRINITY_DN5501_c0_g2~~TRINITY_DN5501_c0_g2_i1.p1  ORF type:complete len:225 (-),score=26.98 TRINITY_DN5501_c0_g2_i1:221-895(-)
MYSSVKGCSSFQVRKPVGRQFVQIRQRGLVKPSSFAQQCYGNGGGNNNNNNLRKYGGGDDNNNENSGGRIQFSLVATAVGAIMSTWPSQALARKEQENENDQSQLDEYVDNIVDLVPPALYNLGLSGMMGLASAVALVVVGKALAVAIGISFALLQGLAYLGFIDVHWTKVSTSVNTWFDRNYDGKFDSEDVKIMVKELISFLSHGVPSVAGFAAGFFLGLKMF